MQKSTGLFLEVKLDFLKCISEKVKKANKGTNVTKKSTYHYLVLHL